jgi:hypothetical protein
MNSSHECPICHIPLPIIERYPNYICPRCVTESVDESGRLLDFSNLSLSGGFEATYQDSGEVRKSHTCFIHGIECYADEAKLGGIVVEPISMLKPIQLVKINYEQLNSKQKEIYNFQKIGAVLADYGFNCIKLADDWQGADFIAYHKDGQDTLKIQLKSRLTISKKYLNKGLHLAFPLNGEWYLVDHDFLVAKARQNTPWLESVSWVKDGTYHTASPSDALLNAIAYYKLGR